MHAWECTRKGRSRGSCWGSWGQVEQAGIALVAPRLNLGWRTSVSVVAVAAAKLFKGGQRHSPCRAWVLKPVCVSERLKPCLACPYKSCPCTLLPPPSCIQENANLYNRLLKIEQSDSSQIIRPSLSRSTVLDTPGVYTDSMTGAQVVDHINMNATSCPRSLHYRGSNAGSGMATPERMRSRNVSRNGSVSNLQAGSVPLGADLTLARFHTVLELCCAVCDALPATSADYSPPPAAVAAGGPTY